MEENLRETGWKREKAMGRKLWRVRMYREKGHFKQLGKRAKKKEKELICVTKSYQKLKQLKRYKTLVRIHKDQLLFDNRSQDK